jgi:hypothetical protein
LIKQDVKPDRTGARRIGFFKNAGEQFPVDRMPICQGGQRIFGDGNDCNPVVG